MRFWDSLLIFAAAVLLVACGSTRVLTEVESMEKALTDLNATMQVNGKVLEGIREQQLLLPKGSPGYLAVGRKVALLMEESSNLALQWEGGQMDLEEARRKEAKAATAATNAPPVFPTDTNTTSNTQPVQTVGDLKLYPFTLTTDADQGTKAVTGEVENTGPDALTDVSVAFTVLDSDGQNVGTVSDQTATLEPGVRWTFKALVLDSTADKSEFLEFKVDGNPVTPLSTPPAPGATP
ncbi:MAG: FxLYD domain-containing protein [Verrucomicrobiota bacterium]|nr:FxLYD domain-containing protein [Verrucomicrobiota bacterium]